MDGYNASLFNIRVFSSSKEELLKAVMQRLKEKSSKPTAILFTPNPEQFVITFHDPSFRILFGQSTWNIPDGQGIVWAMKQKGKQIQRIAGREVFHDLLQVSRDHHWKLVLIGGKPGSAKTLIGRWLNVPHGESTPWVYDEGAVDIAHETREEEQRVLNLIRANRPDIVFVAYGAPWQERWLIGHRDELSQAGVKLAMAVGGSFDYEAGKAAQVPDTIVLFGLEWFWRLLHEPWRWKRQFIGLEFFVRVLLSHP